MKIWFLTPLAFLSLTAHSLEIGSFRLSGHASGGYNEAQGTYGAIGADFYTFVQDNLAVGVGAYYAAGQHPDRDREIGVGPFVSYAYPILEFLSVGAREEINYVDQHDSIFYPSTGSFGTRREYGVASITSVNAAVSLTRNFFVSVGYRIAVGLNNSDLEHNRSGVFFGLGFGI